MSRPIQHMKRHVGAEALGWIGASAILGSYALASFGIITSDALLYNALFLVGSAGLAVITYRHRAYQSFVVNVIFIVLATVAIIRLVLFY